MEGIFNDVQSVLKPIEVRNPYAEQLRIPKTCFKPLRTIINIVSNRGR